MQYHHLISLEILQSEKLNTTQEKAFWADDVFALLQEAYGKIKGGLHFASADELLLRTSLWEVIYWEEEIIGVLVYKQKNGLKMVALGISLALSQKIRGYVKTFLASILKLSFGHTWMEVSEGLERFVLGIGGRSYLLSHDLASRLTGKEILAYSDDGYHYIREINAICKSKVIVGSPKY